MKAITALDVSVYDSVHILRICVCSQQRDLSDSSNSYIYIFIHIAITSVKRTRQWITLTYNVAFPSAHQIWGNVHHVHALSYFVCSPGCINYVTMTADWKALERIYQSAIIRDVTKDWANHNNAKVQSRYFRNLNMNDSFRSNHVVHFTHSHPTIYVTQRSIR